MKKFESEIERDSYIANIEVGYRKAHGLNSGFGCTFLMDLSKEQLKEIRDLTNARLEAEGYADRV